MPFHIFETMNLMHPITRTQLLNTPASSALVAIAAALLCASAAASQAQGLIVKYRPQVASGVARALPQPARMLHGERVVDLDSAEGAALRARLARYRADPQVEYAEPNYLGHFADLPAPLAQPNDPAYADQWWHEATGARQAWAISAGSGITVAVLDTGVDLSHPDLQANLRSDGYNFGDDNNNAQDKNGHGTAVAGLVAATCRNGVGGCGQAYAAKLLPIKINPGSTGTFTSLALANSIDYAVAHQAKVINLSVTVDRDTQTVSSAIDRAIDAGVAVVVSTGNGVVGGAVEFPANYPRVIAVSGVDRAGTLTATANRGPETTIAAGGNEMYSTLLGGSNGLLGGIGQGTSFASPVVAGAAAQLLALDARYTPARITALLRQTALPISGASQPFGQLNPARLLAAAVPDLQVSQVAASLQVDFSLPLTAGAVDIYLAASTPFGEYCLQPDGSWLPVASSGYRPLLPGFDASSRISGRLFGQGGVWPALSLAGLPAGSYRLRAAAFNNSAGKLVGPIIETPFTVTQ